MLIDRTLATCFGNGQSCAQGYMVKGFVVNLDHPDIADHAL